MKQVLVIAVLIAGLSGCSSVQQTAAETQRSAAMEPLLLQYAAMAPTAKYACIVAELRTVGAALRKYAKAHNGTLPPRLTTLVTEAYLPAGGLVSSADPTAGKEGGVPNSYLEWGQATETDEAGSSYLYEFSEAPCKWDWQSYLGDHPGTAAVDTNRDGIASWSEVKSWQLLHGDVVQQPKNGPYPISRLPAVRCYWFHYPDAYTNVTGHCVVNLAADLTTVYVSQAQWEKDQ